MYVCVNERTSEVGAGSDRERCDGCSCVHVPCVCVCVCVCVYDISTLYIYIYIYVYSLSRSRALSLYGASWVQGLAGIAGMTCHGASGER